MLFKLQPPPCVECRQRTLEPRNRPQRYHHQPQQKTGPQQRPQSAGGNARPWIVGKNVRPWSAGKDSRPPTGHGGRYQNTDDVCRNTVSAVDSKSGGAKYVRRERRALPIVPPQSEPMLEPHPVSAPASTEEKPADFETKSTLVEGKNEEVPCDKIVEAEPNAALCTDAACNDTNLSVSHPLPASTAVPPETIAQ